MLPYSVINYGKNNRVIIILWLLAPWSSLNGVKEFLTGGTLLVKAGSQQTGNGNDNDNWNIVKINVFKCMYVFIYTASGQAPGGSGIHNINNTQ